MSDAPAAPSAPTPSNQNVPPPGANENPRHAVATPQEPSNDAQGQPKASPARTEAPKQQEYIEIKVDGKTKRITRDEAIRRLQIEDTSTARFESAAQKERRADEIINRAKANPIEALMSPELGLSKEQIRDSMEAWYKREFIDPEGMSKEQIELRDLRAERDANKKEKEAAAERQRAQDLERETDTHRETLQKQILDVLQSKQVPSSKFTAGRLAYFMRLNASKGIDAPMDMLVNQVNTERKGIVRGELEAAPDADALLELCGEDLINKIRKADLQRLRDARSQKAAPTFGGISQPSSGPDGKIDMDQVTRNLRKLQGRA